MAARQHCQQPYLSLNPYGRVPTLEEDGFVLFESTAILNYLEAIRPAPPLVPADAQGREARGRSTALLSRVKGMVIWGLWKHELCEMAESSGLSWELKKCFKKSSRLAACPVPVFR